MSRDPPTVPQMISGSPAARGPAGTYFEAMVGASYLLGLLAGSEPRGLPGRTTERVRLQAAGEGFPLDDIVVEGRDALGEATTLEIQVKRTITFAPADGEFRDVVRQIAASAGQTGRREFAVATSQHTSRIDGPYQEVLAWARQLGDAPTFMQRLARPNCASDPMRKFVATFREHLEEAGHPHDDATVWGLLRRFQIHVYDFGSSGSADAALARERAVGALHPEEMGRAGELWSWMVETALSIAARAGERTRTALLADVGTTGFRLAGDRRTQAARAALAEASAFAMAQISDEVAGARLARHRHSEALRTFLATGRYVEIRGEAGVGKSGVMKQFALEVATHSRIVFLTPERTCAGGWLALRAQLGFDGLARELLVDMAAGGGGFLFIDNLDQYAPGAQATICDLARAAADIPGFRIVATARPTFGVDTPNWLAATTVEAFGDPQHVNIHDLTPDEVEELSEAAPRLAALLAEKHPARAVSRNLFRLGRLAVQADSSQVATEVDLALQWWRDEASADATRRRDRGRGLRDLATQALAAGPVLDASGPRSEGVDALVAEETLIDLHDDRVSFRHDVLREWAIGCVLDFDRTLLERLPLAGAASVSLARGVEIAARIAIERNEKEESWVALLQRLSAPGVHVSWRRAVLLALARSELWAQTLTRAGLPLLADQATLLRELIRLVIAVEVDRASKVYGKIGVDPALIPETLVVPNSPAWPRLIQWLLLLGEHLPNGVIPEVAELYLAWSVSLFGQDELTAEILPWVHRWLTEIERARKEEWTPETRPAFDGEVEPEALRRLESALRTTFVLFARRVPDLAKAYLNSLSDVKRAESAIESILQFCGSLAEAAPAELAQLTRRALLGRPRGATRRDEAESDFDDIKFMPASPGQGPFLELLQHAPAHGIALVRDVVDHTIKRRSRRRTASATNAIVLLHRLDDETSSHPWVRSYRLSRDEGHYAVASALMALEAWGHRRIEAGEDVALVLADVCPPGAPAAFVLVAVDLIVSHWPKSAAAAIPFVTCPELIVLDRERQVTDTFQFPDPFGFMALQREPRGAKLLKELRERPSRKHSLYDLIDLIAQGGDESRRLQVVDGLTAASARLGEPDPEANLSSPAFMAIHAVNRLDPARWTEREIVQGGERRTYLEYVSPENEARHLERLSEEGRAERFDSEMQIAVSAALDKPGRSPHLFAAKAVTWAQGAESTEEDNLRKQAIVGAAMLALRDGDARLRDAAADWAKGVFMATLKEEADAVHRVRGGARFNRPAIAFLGLAHGYLEAAPAFEAADLVKAASDPNPAAAWGLAPVVAALHERDERLPRAIVRAALTARIEPLPRWPDDEIAVKEREHCRECIDQAVCAELAWLAGQGAEPSWPELPLEVHLEQGFRIFEGAPASGTKPPGDKPAACLDHDGAALWMGQVGALADLGAPWVADLLRRYSKWTRHANGGGEEPGARLREPRRWNEAYYGLLARCMGRLPAGDVEALCIRSVVDVPDEPFLDLVAAFLRSIDQAYFDGKGITCDMAFAVRRAFAERLMRCSGWRRLLASRENRIEMRLGPAVAVLFFSDHEIGKGPKCYLLPPALDRAKGTVPILRQLAVEGPSYFVAAAFLNFCEALPGAAGSEDVLLVAAAWLDAFPNDRRFWVEADYGQRLCAVVAKGLVSPRGISTQLDELVDRVASVLIGLGVPEASYLARIAARGGVTGDQVPP